MLKVAHDKIKKHGHSRSKFMEGDLEKPSDLPMNDELNLITCMHNVIGMARDTKAVLKNLASLLQTGGIAFIMAMNKYHALNFNLETGNEYEIQRTLCDGTIKFKEDMPEMLCYTPREFQSELEAAGFSRVVVLGYPVTVYPSSQDTKLQHFRTTEEMLKNPALRNQLLEVEKRLCINPELAYRGGSSLIAICGK